MKRFFSATDACIARLNWKDMAWVKLCLSSVGLLGGLLIPQRGKKWAAPIAGAIFLVSYVLVMAKFLPMLIRELRRDPA